MDNRKLYLQDLIREIDKAQEEINAAEHFELSSVGLHNGLTLANSIAYKLSVVEE
jgi:hypothetical protein